MAARQFRILLLLEFLIYGLTGNVLLGRGSWSAEQVTWLALASFLGLRLGVVLLVHGLARLDAARPKDYPSGALATLHVLAGEYIALLLLFVVAIPFEGVFGPDRLGHCGARRVPLLLIHGYQCNRGFWFWLRPKLEEAGWTVATHSLEPVYADIDSYAVGIARRIDEVLAATGAPQLVLIGHSMGGLACRAYLRRHGARKVAKLVTLGSPHQGSGLARFGLGANARQMRIGSPWLADLASLETLPPGSVSISSHHDSYVHPDLSRLAPAGGKDVVVSGVGHLGQALSSAVLGKLQEALDAP
ncbi:MAG: alpha/beta fold hydrolase [Rhodocyclales bacterium]|nr:alpha/beta fold hydrolase [Rhodocyclales bacterium]